MLWLALHFDRLPLEVFERALPGAARDDGFAPLRAICEQRTVRFVDDAARSAGIESGMPRASALALRPDLQLLERDPERERTAIRGLANWALQFTPSVCYPPIPQDRRTTRGAATPAGLLLEIAPSLRLFGGLERIEQRLRDDLRQLGYQASLAIAPTAGGAWLFARIRDGHRCVDPIELSRQLPELPLSLLSSAQHHLQALESIGARRIGDVLALPRAGLSRRFGPGLLDEIDRAQGLRPEAHAWLQAPVEFSARLELLAQIEHTEPLLFAARRMLVELTGWLAARQAAVRCFVLEAEHDDAPHTRIEIRLNDPSREIDRLAGLLRERLAVTRLRAPVHTIGLECTEILPLTEASGVLFPSPDSARQGIGRLLERLQARLGRDRVQRLHLVADHRPEAAYRVTTIDRLDDADPRSRPASAASHAEPGGLPRPIWLLQKPVRLHERNNQPWWHTPLVLVAGPERIETGWWDQSLVQRDYFVAADTQQVLYWIYRERAGRSGEAPGWYIHGRFG